MNKQLKRITDKLASSLLNVFGMDPHAGPPLAPAEPAATTEYDSTGLKYNLLRRNAVHEGKVVDQLHGVIPLSRRRRRVGIMEMRRTISDHLYYMTKKSSFHGVSYMADKKHPYRRLIWFLTTGLALAYCAHKVYGSTVKYLRYPVTTSVRRQYVNSLLFPAVTFCNLNDMRLSMMNNTMLDRAILDRSLLANVTYEDFQHRLTAAHKIEEMLVECIFDGHPCSHKNFTISALRDDQCFTINSGKNGQRVLRAKGSGVKRSLMLTINIQHYDYYRDRTDGGVHLILHDHNQTPVRSHGLNIPPGFATYIQIDKKRTINLKSPYNTRCGSIHLKHHKKYSVDACWLEQLTEYVVRNCSCKADFMPGNTSNCNGAQSFCMWQKWEEFEQQRMSECPLPCEQNVFQYKSVSRTLFPSHQYAQDLKAMLEKQKHMEVPLSRMRTDVKSFMRQNLLRLIIFYDDLSFELQEHKPSYDLPRFLGDIGGQVGLFIGASVLSYFEIIDCIGMIIHSRFFQSNEYAIFS